MDESPVKLDFSHAHLTPAEVDFQREVRDFLAAELPKGSYFPGLGMDSAWDPAFSRKLAARGWLGMTLPRRYGGSDRPAVDRFVLTEELLRWGAPLEYHWIADRQTGPIINRFGTEEQRERFLPAICRGEVAFSIGMSEPDAGSDLAAVSTRATKVDGGWRLNGTKVWTSGAHLNDWFVVLCRTSDEPVRHAGLSQLLVDLKSDGLDVHPIPLLDGSHHFNEVVFRDVFVPDNLVLGEIGSGWAQNTSELVYERGGPERWLSSFTIVEWLLREPGEVDQARLADLLGGFVPRWSVLRQMSLSIARLIDLGRAPAMESAIAKLLGTRFEQDVVEAVSKLVDVSPDPHATSVFTRLLSRGVLTSPIFSIRGGTSEVLTMVIAKGLARP